MLNLSTTSDKLQVINGTASTIDVHVSYADLDDSGASRTVTVGSANTAITTAATTDVTGSPGTSIVRNVKFISIANKHASVGSLITVQHVKSSPTVNIWKSTLAAGESLMWTEDIGWRQFDTNGNIKTVAVQSLTAVQMTMSVSQTINAGTALVIPKKFTIQAGAKLTIAATAKLRVI